MRIFIENRLLLLGLVILALSSASIAQVSGSESIAPPTQTDESCEILIVQMVGRVPRIAGRMPERLSHPIDQQLISPELLTLLKDVPIERLIGYRFKGPRQTALVLRTTRVGSPLSDDSIQDWFIQVGTNAATFRSVATNPNLLFWDQENRLNYFTILFREGAGNDGASNLVSLNFRQLQLHESGIAEVVEEQENVRCVLPKSKIR